MKSTTQSSGGAAALEKYNPSEVQAAAPASWAKAKYYAVTAKRGAMAMVAGAVMCGFVLAELKKKLGIKQGARTDNFPSDSGSWKDLCHVNAGVTDDTANKWIDMANGVRAKWKKLAPSPRIHELMRIPMNEWTDADHEGMFAALSKATDGSTMVEFMRELGIAKLKTGNNEAEGNGSRKLSAAEDQQKQLELAFEDSEMAGRWTMKSLKTVILTCRENDLELDTQISVHEFALKALFKIKRTPRDKRDDKMLSEYQSLIEKESPIKAA